MLYDNESDGSLPTVHAPVTADDSRLLAETLHDGVMQLLSALRLKVRLLCLEADALSAEGRANLRDLDALSDRALMDLSSLVRGLSGTEPPPEPPVAVGNYRALAVRLEDIAAAFQDDTGIDCRVDLDESQLRFPRNLEDVICRSVGELLNNVEKHAGARRVHIRSDAPPDGYVSIGVVDDGRGCPDFAWSKLPYAASGLGLLSVQNRLADFGARVEIEGRHGFSVRLVIPDGLLLDAD